MAGLYQYVTSLMPSTEARAIKENLELAGEKIATNLLPGLSQFEDSLKYDYVWKNKEIGEMLKEIAKELRSHKSLKLPANASGIEAIDAVLKNVQRTLPYIQGEINKTFDSTIFKSGLTFTKATLLQYAETVDFVITYTALFMNWMTASEYNTLDGRERMAGIPVGDLEYIHANIRNYVLALSIMAHNQDELKRGLKSLPQMRIAETAEGEAEQLVLGGGNGDPFGFAQMPFPLSLWYHYRLRRVESQATEFEKDKATERAIHYRIVLIKQQLEAGKGDAALAKELKIQEQRVKELSYEIAQLEKKYKLNLEG